MSFDLLTKPSTDVAGAPGNSNLLRDVYAGIVHSLARVALKSNTFIATHVLQRGQSAKTFYANGKTKASYIPNDLTAMTQASMEFGKLTITPDDSLYTDNIVTEQDEQETPIQDLATRIATEQGEALQLQSDRIGFLALAKAASTAAIVPDLESGLVLEVNGAKTDVPTFISAVGAVVAARARAGIDLRALKATIVVTPELYFALCNNKDFIDRNYGGKGGFVDGFIDTLFGLKVDYSSNLPYQDLSDDAAITAAGLEPALIKAKYRGDYSELAALILTPASGGSAAVAKVVSQNVKTIAGLSLMETGHGVLGKRWSAVERYGMEVLDPSKACAIYDVA